MSTIAPSRSDSSTRHLPENEKRRSVIVPLSRPLLTVRQVAALLSVSTATVYRLCDLDELPHTRIGNVIRVAPADLEAYLAGERR